MNVDNIMDPICGIIVESNQEVIYSFCLRPFTESVSYQLVTQTMENLKASERIAIISNNDEHIFRKFRREEYCYPQLREALMDHKLTSLHKLAS